MSQKFMDVNVIWQQQKRTEYAQTIETCLFCPCAQRILLFNGGKRAIFLYNVKNSRVHLTVTG